MAQPTFTVRLDAGTHWLCTCGHSSNAPYCNGSHKGSEFQPLALELPTAATVEISGSANTNTHQ
ncbi:MAG: CDGSH iron-sulfur domain-containing protein [Oculatellaceae cyanobacterium bins.114]|nr:CDGSH iron-sulfur domain-containing protein [Oculatellaceae cyanobacterium bins.114]